MCNRRSQRANIHVWKVPYLENVCILINPLINNFQLENLGNF